MLFSYINSTKSFNSLSVAWVPKPILVDNNKQRARRASGKLAQAGNYSETLTSGPS
jgi:hypothetical protein